MGIKKTLRRACESYYDRRYERELNKYKGYGNYRMQQSESAATLPSCTEKELEQVVFLQEAGAEYLPGMKEKLAAYLLADSKLQLVYADEECPGEGGLPGEPWYKPDWSPDSFLYRDYLGQAVAVRRDFWDTLSETQTAATMETGLPDGLNLTNLHSLLVHAAGGFEKGCTAIGHFRQVCLVRKGPVPVVGEALGGCYLGERIAVPEGVSVIIPSKDNPEVLGRCITTLLETADGMRTDIIVVDNGSNPENKEKVEALASSLGFRYFHEPMEFNFSRMCNLGASYAKEEFLLFLNDDITCPVSGWIKELAEKTARPWVGCAGLKLYYPDSIRMQHAGVVNVELGPLHKLQYLPDDRYYYDGRNKGVWDMAAVTGACLMIRREVLAEIGGWREELRVAFNDIDLCYSLLDANYYNVECNDVYLYHHESLSRGNDDLDTEKQRRLRREARLLYRLHPHYRDYDPFYSPHLNHHRIDVRIKPSYQDGVVFRDERILTSKADLEGATEDPCLQVGVEFLEPGKLEGYALVLGSDNACFKGSLVLKKEDGTYLVTEYLPQYRSDVEENCPDQKNAALTGFCVTFPEPIPEGTYRVGVLMKDRLSGLKLVRFSNRLLEIPEPEI